MYLAKRRVRDSPDLSRHVLGQEGSQGLPRPQVDCGPAHSRPGLAKHGEPLPVGGCSPHLLCKPQWARPSRPASHCLASARFSRTPTHPSGLSAAPL